MADSSARHIRHHTVHKASFRMSIFFSCIIDASMMKKRRLAEDEVAEEEEDTTSELIKSRGDSVYFYAEV